MILQILRSDICYNDTMKHVRTRIHHIRKQDTIVWFHSLTMLESINICQVHVRKPEDRSREISGSLQANDSLHNICDAL